jgi:hypothetical protein
VCFVNSALLNLMSQQRDCGFVAHVGSGTAWVACFHQRQMIGFIDLRSTMTNGETVKECALGDEESRALQEAEAVNNVNNEAAPWDAEEEDDMEEDEQKGEQNDDPVTNSLSDSVDAVGTQAENEEKKRRDSLDAS